MIGVLKSIVVVVSWHTLAVIPIAVRLLCVAPLLLYNVAAYLYNSTRTRGQHKVSAEKARIAVVGGGIAGVSAAWSLAESGYSVDLFEARHELGGNAKTHNWSVPKAAKSSTGSLRTGLSVLAWPPSYFHNYCLLLKQIGVESVDVELPFMVKDADGQLYDQERASELKSRFASDLRRWRRMIQCIRHTGDFLRSPLAFLSGKKQPRSFYAMSVVNPFNIIPLRLLSWFFCVSTEFWDTVVVSIYSSSFLTAKMDYVPACIGPILWDLLPLDGTPHMDSWTTTSSTVFQRLSNKFVAHTSCPVEQVKTSRRDGRYVHEIISEGKEQGQFDRVVFACPATTIADVVENQTWMERFLLHSVHYTDDNDTSFLDGTIHTDATVIPKEVRKDVLNRYANYIEVSRNKGGDLHYENTFCFGSWIPAVQRYKAKLAPLNLSPAPMLVTYHQRKEIDEGHIVGKVSNARAHPHLHLGNLALSVMVRMIQGKRGLYYCGSYTTPGNGHDLSLLSGLIVAHALGARYPFEGHDAAKSDFEQLRLLMGL